MYKTYAVEARKLNQNSRKYRSIQPEMDAGVIKQPDTTAMDHNVLIERHYLYGKQCFEMEKRFLFHFYF